MMETTPTAQPLDITPDGSSFRSKAATLLLGLSGLLSPALLEARAAHEVPSHSAAQPSKPVANAGFGGLSAPSLEQAKEHTMGWLKAKNVDPQLHAKIEAIWLPASQRSNLERVVESFSLADPAAAKLISLIHDRGTPVPYGAPEILKDKTLPEFFRANLGLYVAKELGLRRAHDEVLEILSSFPAEQTVDPATYYFYRACAEMSLLKKDDAAGSINKLLDTVTDTPSRYAAVAQMMRYDIEGWKDQDLGHVKRLMDDVGRRLDLSRGGKKTQDEQKEIVAILDKLIKEKEDQQNSQNQANNSNPANQPGSEKRPSDESRVMGGTGAGKVDDKKLRQVAEQWGQMPPHERAKVVQEITRDLPPKYRQIIEDYFKALARTESSRPPR